MATLTALDGLNIIVYSTPLLESLSQSLMERGANVSVLPVQALRFRSLPGWIADIVAGDYDDAVFSTAHGVRLALEYAAELGNRSAFVSGLQATRLIALGRRTVRALTEAGLTPDLVWTPAAGDAIETLVRGARLGGRMVGLQSSSEEGRVLQSALEAADARVSCLSPETKEEADPALLEPLLRGGTDVVVFGASGQVQAVLSASVDSNRASEVDAALRSALVICPEAAANSLRQRRIHARTIPGRRLSVTQVEPLLASVRRKAGSPGRGGSGPTKRRIVVIGNGMVGHRFCERLAELGAEDCDITVVGEEPRAAYDRVHLTNYFSTRNADDLALGRLDWYAEHGIQLMLAERVFCIRRDDRFVETSSGACIPYDDLVLATGSSPFVPSVPGVDREGVFVYRTIEDLDAIAEYSAKAKTAAVIGGGLLGLEAAKALLDLGLEVHVAEVAPRLMPRQLDAPGAALLARKIAELGVRLHVGKAIARISGDASVTGIRFNDGASLGVDLVVISAGIRPRDELARSADIAVGDRGGILVDDELRTSDPNIFAIGECAAHSGMTYGLVAPGYEMADVLATTLSGGRASFKGADLSAKLKLLGIDVASFGDPFADGSSRTVVFEDLVSGVYKKLVLDGGGTRLLGGILVGEASQYMTLAHLARTGKELPATPEALLFGSRGSLVIADDSMPVCSCNNVSRQTICEAIRKASLTTVNDVKGATRAGTGCGGCLPNVGDILNAELKAAGRASKARLCEHFACTRTELFEIIRAKRIRTFEQLIAEHGTGSGCEICKPTAASIFASVYNDDILQHDTLQDTNDRFLANVQRSGLYSVVPRVPGGEITPEKLITLGRVAQRFGLYTKITGGQRVDLFGARLNDLPEIWEELVRAGFESGHAYGKAMRTVKSCVGSTWCRYGVRDSVAFAIRVENRYKGVRAPHKLKSAVSGCIRECAEAQSKDFGLIATEKGYNLYVCGNGGAKPRHADLLASDLDEETAIRYLDRFIMFYIRTADRLTRTSVWLDKMEGGIEHLRDVIVRDSLGICAQLEADMQDLVDTYRCEWAEVVKDPAKREKFRHFANSEQGDNSVSLVAERGQRRPADWPPIATATASNENGPTEWVRVAPAARFPRDGGMAVAVRARQIAVFYFAARDAWYAVDNRCPHKGDQVLARGIIGDQCGTPKVACPLHKKTFSLEDGRCLTDEEYVVSTYTVRVQEGWVYVEVPVAPPAFVPAERLLAKKVAHAPG